MLFKPCFHLLLLTSLQIVQTLWRRRCWWCPVTAVWAIVFSYRDMKLTNWIRVLCMEKQSRVHWSKMPISKGRLFSDHFLCQWTTGTTNPRKENVLFISDLNNLVHVLQVCLDYQQFPLTRFKHARLLVHAAQTGRLNSSCLCGQYRAIRHWLNDHWDRLQCCCTGTYTSPLW